MGKGPFEEGVMRSKRRCLRPSDPNLSSTPLSTEVEPRLGDADEDGKRLVVDVEEEEGEEDAP